MLCLGGWLTIKKPNIKVLGIFHAQSLYVEITDNLLRIHGVCAWGVCLGCYGV